jgi:cell division GTPase FtsZ
MTTRTTVSRINKEEIMDDITDSKAPETTADTTSTPASAPVVVDMDGDKLAKLKERLAAKQKEAAATPEMGSEPRKKPEKSISFGVIGSGQMGSRLTESFWKLGYNGIVINTAPQDLKFIDMPESNKLLLDYGLGGAAKSLDFGLEAALAYKDQITKLVSTQFADAQAFFLTFSAGGGSGAGSAEVIIDVLAQTNRPIVVITTLPMASDDATTKHNTLETLGKLTKMLQSKVIANLFVIDNAKLESIFADVGQLDFFHVANNAIATPIDAFNTLSSMPSSNKGLDPNEFSRLMFDGDGLSIFSSMTIEKYQDDTAIAEAIVSNLGSSLLADGFAIDEARYVGFMVVANSNVWKTIPASSINYALAIVNDVCKNPLAVFKGVYAVENPKDVVIVYTMISGLSLPKSRIDELTEQSKQLVDNTKAKDSARNLNLTLPTTKNDTISAAQRVKDKMSASKSNFSKFQSNIIDRRK